MDGNGKITSGNGTFADPRPNAFSLVEIADCPFSTLTCQEVCYVGRLRQAEPEVYRAYRHNSAEIRSILINTSYRLATELVLAEWISKNCPHGFRWHVSGDIFSWKYAEFIRNVCLLALNVKFWIYTRSFPFLLPLFNAGNLTINLSADQDNYTEALRLHLELGYRICYLTVDGTYPFDLPKNSVIFPHHELRGRDLLTGKRTQTPFWQSLDRPHRKMVCPADYFGQSERRRCGHGHCDICLTKTLS